MANLTVTSAPAEPAITPAEVREQFRFVDSAEDGLLTAYIEAATGYLEDWLRRAFVRRTYMLRLDSFALADRIITPCGDAEILLPYPPLSQVNSVVYDDADGVEQTFAAASYQVDVYSEPGRLSPVPGESWPTTQSGAYNAVRISFDTGHASAAAVPQQYKQLLRWIVGLWFRNREPVAAASLQEVPHTVEEFINQFKIWRIG